MEMNRKENKRTPANFNIVNSGGKMDNNQKESTKCFIQSLKATMRTKNANLSKEHIHLYIQKKKEHFSGLQRMKDKIGQRD